MRAGDAYVRCQTLFVEYPQAVRLAGTSVNGAPVNGAPWAERSMVLMVRGGDRPRFFILSQEDPAGGPFCLFPWRAPGATLIPLACEYLPDADAEVLTLGVPIPRHESVFGWVSGSAITGLILAYGRYTPQSPTPNWAVLPCLDTPRDGWPPFTYKKVLGRWFWEYVRSGTIRALDPGIAATRGTVLWADTTELLGADSCVVTHEVAIADGLRLPAGRYVDYQAALSGRPVPAPDALLRDAPHSDLAARGSVDMCRIH